MLMETIDTSSPYMENSLQLNTEEQKEINKSIIQIIFEILFENGKITSDERESLIKNSITK